MRLFLAINLPPELRSELYNYSEPLRRAAPDVSWVLPELLHFTVKFLGEVQPERVEPIRLGLSAALAHHAPFQMTLSGGGCFPNFRRPRVVWIGVKAHRRVFALAEDVEEACELLGFERDARGFTPHLTVGRVKKDLSGDSSAALERAAHSLHTERVLDVTSVDLMQSELGSGGPKYRLLARLALLGES